MIAYWGEFAVFLLTKLSLLSISALPLAGGTIAAVRHLRARRLSPYIRNLCGSITAGLVTLGLLFGSLFGDDLSRSSTAAVIFVFVPFFAAGALVIGLVIGAALTRTFPVPAESSGSPPPISAVVRSLVSVPIVMLAITIFGIIRLSIQHNHLVVAEHGTRPETLQYAFDRSVRGDADRPGVLVMLAQNANTPASILEKLGESEFPEVRAWLMKNPHTPIAVVVSLRSDCSPWVREAVEIRLKAKSGSNP